MVYEVYLLKKHTSQKGKVSIPDFKEGPLTLNQATVIEKKEKRIEKKSLNMAVTVSIVLLIIFGLMSVVGLVHWTQTPTTNTTTEVIQSVRSAGIKMYHEDFTELDKEELSHLQGGTKIIVGIDKTSAPDIDSARIRINTLDWNKAIVTQDFNAAHNVYFIKYEVATAEGELNIQAQLHSKTEGWLGN